MRGRACHLGAAGLAAWAAAAAAQVGPGVTFTEVTGEAGLTFRYVNGASGRKHMPEPIGSGAAFFDADGDGGLDLYVVNGAALPGYEGPTGPNALYRNRGDGTFVEVTAQAAVADTGYGMGAATGDFDNDGDTDLYVTNYGPNALYRNRGDGVFEDVTAATGTGDRRWSTSAAFADVDLDGDLDLYAANYMRFDPQASVPCTAAGVPVYCGPTVYPGESGVLYRNGGGLAFADATAAAGLDDASGRQLAAVFSDLDLDGDPDLFIANDKTPNFLFVNAGDGTFQERGILAGVAYNGEGVAESAMGADVADADNDGRFDIAVATFQWLSNTLYHNDGDGFFTDISFPSGLGEPSVPFLAMSITFLDCDNDGWLDVFVTNGHLDENVADYDPSATYAQVNQLFRNRGDGTFAEVTGTSGPGLRLARVSHGAALGDYDDDGDLDLFVSDSDTPHCTLLRNDGGNRHHWLRLQLRGGPGGSNRDGFGARVRAVAGDLVQVREVRAGYGYLSSSDPRLLLGLGGRDRLDSLTVSWPSGAVTRLAGVAADRTLVVVEPER